LDDWLAFISETHISEIELGLSRVSAVFDKMSIRSSLPYIIMIGGTNGKGSTLAAIEKALLDQGLNVGAYTSPHINAFNERVRLNGRDASDLQLIRAFEQVERSRGEVALTYFEYSTLAAFQLFAAQTDALRLDVLLCEVGLGGRLDAVNILDADVSIITSIGLDHIDWLGDTVEEIAFEKAGILRSDSTAILGETFPRSLLTGLQCEFSKIKLVGRDFGVGVSASGDAESPRMQFDLSTRRFNFERFNSDLPLNNLMLAAQACFSLFELILLASPKWKTPRTQLLRERLLNKPEIVGASVCRSIEGCIVPGRMEVISNQPVTIVDVAHNAQAAEFLARHMLEKFPTKKVYAVFSCLKDKDIHAILAPMSGVVESWYVAPLSVDRAYDIVDLEGVFSSLKLKFDLQKCIEDSLRAAQQSALANDAVVLVFGSFYVVESVKRGLVAE
jgi:dihydrofolate synthase/folylpolyglutamate synthase